MGENVSKPRPAVYVWFESRSWGVLIWGASETEPRWDEAGEFWDATPLQLLERTEVRSKYKMGRVFPLGRNCWIIGRSGKRIGVLEAPKQEKNPWLMRTDGTVEARLSVPKKEK